MERTKPPAGEKQELNLNKEQIEMLAMSALVSRMQWAGFLGYQYGDDRDIYNALGYPRTLTYENFWAMYGRHDMAKAIIDRPVKKTWSGELAILESNDDKETGLEKEFKTLAKDLKLKSKFARLDKLTGICHYGVMLLGFSDVGKPEDFAVPVQKSTGLRLLYVNPLGENNAKIETWEENPQDPRYGLPKLYRLTFNTSDSGATKSRELLVHYTRVLHIVDDPLESEVEGTPRLEVVYNRLMDLDKVVGGSGEMFWRGARPGYTGEIDPSFNMTTTQKEAVKSQVKEYENNLRRLLLLKGIKLEALQTQVADPKNHVEIIIQMVSAVTGIPKRILTGSERGELSSSQDSEEWASYVQDRREEFAEPFIVRAFVDRLIEVGVLPEPIDKEKGYDVQWSDLFAISEGEKVKIGKDRSTALKEYFSQPLAQDAVPIDAFLEYFLGFSQEQIELVQEFRDAMQMVEQDGMATEEEEEMLEEEDGQQNRFERTR